MRILALHCPCAQMARREHARQPWQHAHQPWQARRRCSAGRQCVAAALIRQTTLEPGSSVRAALPPASGARQTVLPVCAGQDHGLQQPNPDGNAAKDKYFSLVRGASEACEEGAAVGTILCTVQPFKAYAQLERCSLNHGICPSQCRVRRHMCSHDRAQAMRRQRARARSCRAALHERVV